MLKHIKKFDKLASEVQGIGKFPLFMNYIWCYIWHRCTLSDYFEMKLYALNRYGIKRYVIPSRAVKLYKQINDPVCEEIFNDKEEALRRFDKYMERMWCGTKYNNTIEDYREFLSKNDECIYKPSNSYGGRGIRKIDISDKEKWTPNALRDMCLESGGLIEEVVCQHEKMAEIHKESVNTIRIYTYEDKIIGAFLRMGRGDSVVDNADAGGISVSVDIETGVIVTIARNYKGDTFVFHPDTKTQIVGFNIPMWEEVVKMTKEIASDFPGIPIKGFDIAISDKGPVLIELNGKAGFLFLQLHSKFKADKPIIDVKEVLKKYKR